MTTPDTTPPPLASVVVPMKNAAPFIAHTLESILAQRTSHAYEVVVLDDASTDGSGRLVETIGDRRVRLVRGAGEGEAMAFNRVVHEARGSIVLRCDADDLWPDDRLQWQVDWLLAHPEFGAVAGPMWTTDVHGKLRVPLGEGASALEITDELLGGATRTSLCTFATRREHILQAGGCRRYFRVAEDIDLQLRLARVCRVWFEPRHCYIYRLHGSSVTHRETVERKAFFERAARTFAAQRRETGTDDLERGCPPAIPETIDRAVTDPGEQLLGHLTGAAWRAHARGARGEALRLAARAVAQDRFAWNSVRTLLVLLLKSLRPSRR